MGYSGQNGLELVHEIKNAVEVPFLVGGRELFIKASIGVAWHPAHGPDARSVFRCAEAALHRSMRRLQSGITYYHSEMRYRARHKFDMEAELRTAIDSGQISAYFQPQLCLRSGRLAGAEALARWTRPDGTIVSPADFVPLSEEMGISDVCVSRRIALGGSLRRNGGNRVLTRIRAHNRCAPTAKFFVGQRFGDQESLCKVAAERSHHFHLLFGLDAFGNYIEAHRLAQCNHRLHNTSVGIRFRQSCNKRLIDLESLHG